MTAPYASIISFARLLFQDLHRTVPSHLVFVLTSASGEILILHSSQEMVERVAGHCGIVTGVSLSEESCGTNAVALALRHREAVAALRHEQHFCALFQQCCSVGYHVKAWDGSIAACVGILGHAQDPFGEKLALVRCIAQALNAQLLKDPLQITGDAAGSGPDNPRPVALTIRQRRVLELYAEGQSYKQIARVMGLSSIKTVEEHLDAVRRKLGVSHRRQCIQCAAELGLLGSGRDAAR